MKSALDLAAAKMRADGAPDVAVSAFRRRFSQLGAPEAGLLPGDELEPVRDLPSLEGLSEPSRTLAGLFDRLVVLKLNGGLGTTMGARHAKSLIEVKPGHSFLDVIATQVLSLRARHGARLPLVLMNSFATRADSLAALGHHPEIAVDVPLDFMQGREPKLRADTLEPVDWPADRAMEWCPPGHGDLYVSLAASGMLERLRAAGYDWAFVSNSDNLGAEADARIVAWAEAEGVPFVMEVVRGTAADRKGGHLARHGDRLVVRESAQVPEGDSSFSDVERWRFYNTNNLWVDLRALERTLAEHEAGPELPLIVNRKTVDPNDPSSPKVLQLEWAMGGALGSIEGARAVEVPRSRFAPVKTTNDLLVVRSDAYELDPDGHMVARFAADPPVVELDRAYFGALSDFEAHFAVGPPSLRRCRRLVVHGDVTFGANVVVEGEVVVQGPARIEEGQVLRG
jgi:UTP--glucose-1-phosphate uridylyltransferase